jgi:uncharacterized protein (TIGR00661 family)
VKILYGVQGTGNGHLSRARSMCKHLARGEFKVDYLFSGRAREKYFDMDCFGDWQCKRGLTFTTRKGKIKPLSTLAKIKALELIRDIKTLPIEDYDLIISDYEPVTAWAAHKRRRPCLGIGHQYAFKHKIPLKGDNVATRLLMNRFAPTSHNLGLHWYHFNAPILPPIIDHWDQQVVVDEKKIIVYLPFEDPTIIGQFLARLPGYEFYYFGEFEKAATRDNIHFNPVSREIFQRNLVTAGGVICNAGFELASESINLGKKILVKPLHGQMEQVSNALALQQLQLGRAVDKLNTANIQDWLENFTAKQVRYPDVAKYIVEWIRQGDLNRQEPLIKTLWTNTHANGLTTFEPYER